MRDKELRKIAWDFRVGLIGRKGSPEGCCFMVSAPLAGLLSAVYGMKVDLVKSDHSGLTGSDCIEHYWIGLEDGRVLDPTFDQFCSEEPVPIYIGSPTEFHQRPSQ
jgi:hypothetical protein